LSREAPDLPLRAYSMAHFAFAGYAEPSNDQRQGEGGAEWKFL
jgi:hypothetical protein